jgi:hypothetical protein
MTWIASEKARLGREREALAEVLLDRAAWTHGRLSLGRSCGVEIHEETITQDLLVDISAVLPQMSIRSFTRRQEARNGADWQWEWWFQGRAWFGMRVQAKRLKELKRSTLGYDLAYRVGSKHERQVDLLIATAHAVGLQSAYVLYNGPDLNLGKIKWECRRLPASPLFFGVSILPATVDLSAVGSVSRPWPCLITCDPSSGCNQLWPSVSPPPGVDHDDLAWWAARSYFRILNQARSGINADPGVESLRDEVLTSMRAEPPSNVGTLLGD